MLLEDYHDFTDMFSKSNAGKLAEHQLYDLKITLDEGTVLPFGPIYSLSQEELAASDAAGSTWIDSAFFPEKQRVEANPLTFSSAQLDLRL